jgi:AraC-like DNA-binding protein
MESTRLLRASPGVPPVYTFHPQPGTPPIGVSRIGPSAGAGRPPVEHAHSHDFLVLVYFEAPGGSVRIADRRWTIGAGDMFLISPGEVVRADDPGDPGNDGHVHCDGWTVYFPPEALGPAGLGAFLGWRSHPLLLPFVRGTAGGAQHRRVPEPDRAAWSQRLAALNDELTTRHEGYREAAPALLTLLLVEVARLASDVVGDLSAHEDPLLSRVFAEIERGYPQTLSTADVARAVGLTPGHLTTVVRRRTGRTVGSWITERRMAAARAMLVQTALPVTVIARRTGYDDPGYFGRTFRRTHGVSPLRWRQAAGGVG